MQPNIILCPNCQAQNAPGESFCKECHSRLCSKCHNVIPPQSKYCPVCGLEVRSWKPPVHTQSQSFAGQQLSRGSYIKTQYSCPSCGTKIEDPSTTECPNCGFLGHMHHVTTQQQIPDSTIAQTPSITPQAASPASSTNLPHISDRPIHGVYATEIHSICPNCSARISPDSRFCPTCGNLCGSGRHIGLQRQAKSAPARNVDASHVELGYQMPAGPSLDRATTAPPARERNVAQMSERPFSYTATGTSTGARNTAQIATGYPLPVSPLLGETKGTKGMDRVSQSPAKGFPIGILLAIVFLLAAISALGYYIYDQNSIQRPSLPPTPPVAITLAISDASVSSITATSAVVTWMTDEPATSRIIYCGPSDVCVWTEPDDALVTSHSVTLSDLEPNTTYHLTVVSKDASGNEATFDVEGNLTTLAEADMTSPVISGINVSNITESSAVIAWTTDEPATSKVEYGLTTAYGSNMPLDEELTTSHSVALSGLDADKTYYFIAKSKDTSGNEAISDSATLKTLPAMPTGTEVGDKAPDFALQNLAEVEVKLSNLRGRIVMVNFWATWCNPCISEMPYIQAISDNWSGDEELVVLAINCGESSNAVRNFLESHEFTFTALLDSEEAVSAEYTRIHSERGIPRTFFIDADGIIGDYKYGRFSSQAEIEDILDSL